MRKITSCISIIILAAHIVFSCKPAHEGFIITGNIEGLAGDSVYVENPVTSKVESVHAPGGKFVYKGRVEFPDVYTFYPDRKYDRFARVFVENAAIEMNTIADSIAGAKVKGSASHDEYKAFQKTIRPIFDRLDNINRLSEEAMKNKMMDRYDSLSDLYQKTADERLSKVLNYALQHKNSVIVPYITARASIDSPNSTVISQIFETLGEDIKRSQTVIGVNTMISNLTKVSVGAAAPVFTATTKEGKTLNLQELKGRVILIDFWASWCGPCRLNHPDLGDIYDEYRDKKLEIISVSLDKESSDWEKAVVKDHLNWNQLCDLQGAQGPIAKNYGVEIIPASFLIGPDGKVAAKNIFRKKLRKEIDRMLAL